MKDQSNTTFSNSNVLLLGVGSTHGQDYKINIVKKVRQNVSKLIVVEEAGHWAEDYLRRDICVDEAVLLPSTDCVQQKANYLIQAIEKLDFVPNGVVTYRQEWLELRGHLGNRLNLPGPPVSAVEIANDKFKTKCLLNGLNLEVPSSDIYSLEALQKRCSSFTYPIFIRPTIGIRSEWARALQSDQDFDLYISDIVHHSTFKNSDKFIVEVLLVGHEVDVDLVLYKGEVVYSKTSDNFPVSFPFALETGHLMPSVLSTVNQEKLIHVSSKASLACGFTDGNIHVELIILPDSRVFLLEINARLGGMYIAEWHNQVWGVDLINAELAVSLGESPVRFVEPQEMGVSLAQLCLRAKLPDEARDAEGRTVLIEPVSAPTISDNGVTIEHWYHGAQLEPLAISGPLNLGAMTINGETPIETFASLVDLAVNQNFKVNINGLLEDIDLRTLPKFCKSSPTKRYWIRKYRSSDAEQLAHLLDFLGLRATFSANECLPEGFDPSTEILCVVDQFRPGIGIVGTVSLHFWRRTRPGSPVCAYIHDLVILPEYRGIGLGHDLLDAAVEAAKKKGCYKIDVDCDKHLIRFYESSNFSSAGICMVQYID